MAYLEFPNYPELPQRLKDQIFAIANNKEAIPDDDLLINSTQEVIDQVKSVYGFYAHETDLGYTNTEARKHFPNLVKYHFLDATDDIKQWVQENIPLNVASVNIQVMEEGTMIAPHIDEIRQFAINYLVQTGGEVLLKFYELKNPADEKLLHPQIFIPYEKLECKEETCVPANTWHILPTNKIHGVDNIDRSSQRISLSISIL